MPQLDPTWFASQLFWLVVSLAVLYTLLAKWVLPRLLGVIDSRVETVSGNLSKAQSLKDEAASAEELYARALVEARARAQAVYTDVELANKQAAEKASAELEQSMHKKIAAAETAIQAKKEEALAHLQGATADLASQVVAKLLPVKPTREQAEQAVARALKHTRN